MSLPRATSRSCLPGRRKQPHLQAGLPGSSSGPLAPRQCCHLLLERTCTFSLSAGPTLMGSVDWKLTPCPHLPNRVPDPPIHHPWDPHPALPRTTEHGVRAGSTAFVPFREDCPGPSWVNAAALAMWATGHLELCCPFSLDQRWGTVTGDIQVCRKQVKVPGAMPRAGPAQPPNCGSVVLHSWIKCWNGPFCCGRKMV